MTVGRYLQGKRREAFSFCDVPRIQIIEYRAGVYDDALEAIGSRGLVRGIRVKSETGREAGWGNPRRVFLFDILQIKYKIKEEKAIIF